MTDDLRDTTCLCPVCHGRGFVRPGFYNILPAHWDTSSTYVRPHETCRACRGTGVVVRGTDRCQNR
jgi:DnaJ-class molecular chaperone